MLSISTFRVQRNNGATKHHFIFFHIFSVTHTEFPGTKERKFRSIREGGAGEHADYWVFLKSGEEFHAYKVDEWYQFMPFSTHRTLDIDQAEERFRE